MLIEIMCLFGGSVVGGTIVAMVASGKISDLEDKLAEAREYGENVWKGNKRLTAELERMQNVADVCAAVSAKKAALQSRIDKALSRETPGANATVRNMCADLRGE